MNQQPTDTGFVPLTGLLSAIEPSLPDTELAKSGSAFFSVDERVMARRFHLQHHIKAGWTYDDGFLVKGEGGRKVRKRVPEYITGTQGTPQFNPLKDAFALRLGAVYVRPGRYRMPSGVMVDVNGMACNPDECPECHSVPGVDNRFFVKATNPNPYAPPWVTAWTYCRTCVAPAEIERMRNEALATPPPKTQSKRNWADRY